MSLESGFVKDITRLIASWERRSLIAASGRRGGGQDGRTEGVIELRCSYDNISALFEI